LENLSGDPEQEYFADGMTEALIADLAKIGALRIISRQSVMQFKGTATPLPEIARTLNVDAVVEGSVLRSGDRVRITTQLVQATPERHLWAETYDRDLHDILTLQSEVAWAIAQEIRIAVSPEEEKRLPSTRTVDPEAHEYYLRGRHFWIQGGLDNFRKAIDYYEKALEKDPEFALAYVGLAEAYVVGAHYAMPPSEAFPNARAAALKALEIDGTLAGAHAALADTKHHNWDWAGAERSFKKAIELNPGLEAVHTWYAGYLAAVGRLDEAIAELKEAIRINPVLANPISFLGTMFYYARQYDQAIEEFRNALELNPTLERAKYGLGLAYMQKSMHQQAVAVLEEAVASPDSGIFAKVGLAQAYAAQGRSAEARKLLEELEELSKQRYVPAHRTALVYAALGEKDQAFLWLEKDYQIRDAELVWINVDPGYDNLRSDPRFQDLLRRMNFPE
jgi:TolB-like protein/Flp pilus assembly protein TadD